MKKPQHIKLKIKLLTEAKEYIKTGRCQGICSALQLSGMRHITAHRNARRQLLAYISQSLVGYLWLEGWQSYHKFRGRSELRVRQDRLDWIDWMIADYKKWG